MIACRFDNLELQSFVVEHISVYGLYAPTLGVGTSFTDTTSPNGTLGPELAALQRTVQFAVLNGCKRNVAAWCFAPSLQVNECCWTPMPVDGRMLAWMKLGMSVTHVDESFWD